MHPNGMNPSAARAARDAVQARTRPEVRDALLADWLEGPLLDSVDLRALSKHLPRGRSRAGAREARPV